MLAIVVVIIVQFIGLVVFYQLLTKNINEQIMRKTEYLEGIYEIIHHVSFYFPLKLHYASKLKWNDN